MSTLTEVFSSLEYGPAPESADRAREWLEAHERRFDHYIGGQWRPPAAGERFATSNPATGERLAEIAQGGPDDVEAAVEAARVAFAEWNRLDGHRRARHLYALARQVQKHSRLFAVLESLDNGKPIRESRDIDIPLVARHFYHHAGWAQILHEVMPDQVPLGVVGQIIPWNFPLLMLAWKIAPALATGNTVVLKPAEYTPLTALLFAEICTRAGLPPGVVNVVTGDGRTGELLVRHAAVAKIAFTGSTEVGRSIRAETAGTGKRLSLELGGKSPFIVFDDADLDSVVEGVVDSIWFNQGEVCCAGSRVLVQESISEEVVARLRRRMEKLRMGDPLDKAVDVGAIIDPVQLERIQALVDTGVQEGGRAWQPEWAATTRPPSGCYFPPTLFTDVSPSARIAQVEIFGPVVVLMSFRTPDEAVELANNTRYGLAASIWSENIDLCLDIARRVKAGTVWVNCTNVFDAASGFGGYRESGFGREGGLEGLWEYVQPAWMESEEQVDAAAASPGGREGSPRRDEGPGAMGEIDRTPKLYIGGKQVRPDSGYSYPVSSAAGRTLGEAGAGNRKDIRNAVEAAGAATGWGERTGHARAQVLYYLAENLSARGREFAERLQSMTDRGAEAAAEEVRLSIERLFTAAAWADKWDGAVHQTAYRNLTVALPEPVGVLGIVCPEECPLLGFISTVAPAIALGNRVVAVPSEPHPLAATDVYQVLDTSDVPGGVVNIVTGRAGELAEVLASHDDVDGLWFFGNREGSGMVERLSAGDMKRTWVSHGRRRDWFDDQQGSGPEFLRHATELKNIWIPYGA